MKKIAVVTTCNEAGWQLYGRRMAETFVEHWPTEIKLTVYAEDFEPDVEGVLVDSLPPWVHNFATRHALNARAHGLPKDGGTEKDYDYRMDAVRFAWKTAAVIDAVWNCEADTLIWMDADTVTHADVPFEFIDGLLPPSAQVAWLDRGVKMYPECGFYALDIRDIGVQQMINDWMLLYRYDKVFSLSEWHDSYVLQQMVQQHKLRTVSLSGPVYCTHPFINGPLGAYFDHLKGPRKFTGKSHAGDLRVDRKEDYWK